MSLLEKSSYRKLTIDDFVESGLMADIPDVERVGEIEWLVKIYENINSMLRDWFVSNRKNILEEEVGKIQNELMVTDWFKKEVDNFVIIGDRTVSVELKLEEETPRSNQEWYFRVYCTYEEFNNFEEIYPKIKEALGEYETSSWDLELYVAGGIIMGENLVNFDIEQNWREKNVLIKAFGFDENMKEIISSADLLFKAKKEFDKETDKIREKGRPETFKEARLLKLKREGEEKLYDLLDF